MKSIPSAVLTLWMPALLAAGLFLFIGRMPLAYWVACIPLLAVLGFMNTLAEIHYVDSRVNIKRWGSTSIPKTDVVYVGSSILEDIGCLKVRRFVPPWGSIYFVSGWSTLDTPHAKSTSGRGMGPVEHGKLIPDFLASALVGASGFIAARALSADITSFRIESSSGHLVAFAVSGILAVFFAFSRKRMASVANGVLFLATFAAGLVRL